MNTERSSLTEPARIHAALGDPLFEPLDQLRRELVQSPSTVLAGGGVAVTCRLSAGAG